MFTLLGCAIAAAKTKQADIEFKKRSDAVELLVRADPMDWRKAEVQTVALLKDYPGRFESYLSIMSLSWQAELDGKRDVERRVASEIAVLGGPDPH